MLATLREGFNSSALPRVDSGHRANGWYFRSSLVKKKLVTRGRAGDYLTNI